MRPGGNQRKGGNFYGQGKVEQVRLTLTGNSVSRGRTLMAWIRTIPPQEAEGELKELYDRVRALFPKEYKDAVPALIRPDGSSERIMTSHSLLPPVMYHIFAALGCLYNPELPLARRQHEMIATLVSSLNRCHY